MSVDSVPFAFHITATSKNDKVSSDSSSLLNLLEEEIEMVMKHCNLIYFNN